MKQKRKYKRGEYRLTQTGRYIIGIGIPGVLSLILLFSMVAAYPNETPPAPILIAIHSAISFFICLIIGLEVLGEHSDKRVLQLFKSPLWIVVPVLFFIPIIFSVYITYTTVIPIIVEKVE